MSEYFLEYKYEKKINFNNILCNMKMFLAIASFVLLFSSSKAQSSHPLTTRGANQTNVTSTAATTTAATTTTTTVDCSIDDSTSTLPECMDKYFVDGILIDGNSNTCDDTKPVIAAKMDLETLFAKAEEIISSGTCEGESSASSSTTSRRKRAPTCGTGNGVGNCEDSTSRLESVFGIKDLGDTGYLIVTNGVPDHCYKDGADKQLGYVCEHYRALLIPKNPVKSSTYSNHSMGPVGIAKSGGFFFNHLSAETTCNVAAITEKQTFDTCDGHSNGQCMYHYHKAPNCIEGFDTCSLMGYSNDGFAIYGKCSIYINGELVPMKSCYRKYDDKNGCDQTHYVYDTTVVGCNLDEANGYTFSTDVESNGEVFTAGTYAYFFTPEYPFSMPGYYGSKNQAQWCVVTI